MQEESPDNAALLEEQADYLEDEVVAPDDASVESVLEEFEVGSENGLDQNGSGELTEEVEVVFDADREAFTAEAILEAASRPFGLSREQAWGTGGRQPEMLKARNTGYLLLREQFGLSTQEIASVVGKKPGAVYTAMRNARNALKTDPKLAAVHAKLLDEFSDAELSPESTEMINGKPDSIEAVDPRVREVLSVTAEHFSTTVEAIRWNWREASQARWAAGKLLQQAGVPRNVITEALNRPSNEATWQILYKKRPELAADLEAIRSQASEPLALLAETSREAYAEEPEFESEAADRLLATVANYFGLERQQLSERFGPRYVSEAKRVGVNLLDRLHVKPGDMVQLIGYKTRESVYNHRSRPLGDLSTFADEIWTAFQEGRDFSEGVVQAPAKPSPTRRRRRTRSRPKLERPLPLPVEQVDRLVLTAANYLGVPEEKVTDRSARDAETTLVRIVAFSLLEKEFGFSRTQIGRHFDRQKGSVSLLLNSDRNRNRLLENADALADILTAFKAGDTLEAHAAELRREREAELATRRNAQPRRFSRDVPPEETDLFQRFEAGDDEAVRTIEQRHLASVRTVMQERLEGSGIPLPPSLPSETLHKTARYFRQTANGHGSFESWVALTAGQAAGELVETQRRAEQVRQIDDAAFVTDTYAAYKAVHGRGSWNTSVEIPMPHRQRVFDRAAEAYERFAAGRKQMPLEPEEFERLVSRLYKTNVLLRRQNKGKGLVPADAAIREFTLIEFGDDALGRMLQLALEHAVRDAKTSDAT